MITLYRPNPETEAFTAYCLALELNGVPYQVVPAPIVTDEQVRWMDSAAHAPVDIGHISESNL